MAEWERETRADYESKGFGVSSGFGTKPALLVVDFIVGFTDPTSPLGGDFSAELAVTAQLQTAFRKSGLPIVYTTVEYKEDLSDGGVFVKKVPSLGILRKGSPNCVVDATIKPLPGEKIISKNYASSFFGTDLDSYLRSQGVDTLVITGATTSGCVRASAVDSLQYAYHTIVVSDAVGDRAQGPHEANLFDIDAKYGDVINGAAVLDYLRSLANSGFSDAARNDFETWWNQGRKAQG
ncbi:MAG: isochorismatase family protein [Rhodospirillaceae bacterium]|jgi:nicotinamidase-related amidase|nr:isochorismatase family protein [Rhodospirillaceae bacterium]MBT4043578.1 isochorismatase family protein [Rhodospirillaceae bacterium]MBT4690964.1 isochorismatase family protein [Rhodospirillaceae bacterium]MBT5079982.1 isochorismatase family protein [Rhodospirillaceae bacterium]MBT5526004.1 isochorismatase family protein [Rhodospirillaceae bacterium]